VRLWQVRELKGFVTEELDDLRFEDLKVSFGLF
jgi:hypothetical protein